MNIATLKKINIIVSDLDLLKDVVSGGYHNVRVTRYDRDYDGKVINSIGIDLPYEEVKPILEKKANQLIQELKELGFDWE